jgi:hypothetical protein
MIRHRVRSRSTKALDHGGMGARTGYLAED